MQNESQGRVQIDEVEDFIVIIKEVQIRISRDQEVLKSEELKGYFFYFCPFI